MSAAPSADDLARARAELGVASDADAADLRRAFRELARAHHPDRGGDPRRFDRVRRAFALLTDAPRPTAPRVGVGRPSRRAPMPTASVERLNAERLDDAARAAVLSGVRTLDAAVVAGWLLGPATSIAGFHAVSRAPGSRVNRAAHALAEGSTSRLTITAVGLDGGVVLRSELTARPRSARRALDGLRLEGAERGRGWVRTRGSSLTRLRQDHGVAGDIERCVLDAVGGLTELLERLAWPLSEWRASA